MELRTRESEFIDSIGFKQFGHIQVIHQRDDGRVVALASDTLEGRHFFVTIADDLTDLRLDKFLSPSNDFVITNYYELVLEEDYVVMDADIRRGQSIDRVKLFYNKQSLSLERIQNFPRILGFFIELADNTFLHLDNDFFDDVKVTRYDKNFTVIWSRTYNDLNFLSAYAGSDNRIYLVGREFLNDGKSEGLIVEVDQEGTILNEDRVTEEPMWNYQIFYTKIIPYKDKLIAIGNNNYNSDSWQANHNFILKIYDKELNVLSSTSSNAAGENGQVRQATLIDNTIYGVAKSFIFEGSASYHFVVDIEDLSTSTESVGNLPLSIYPNPVQEELSLEIAAAEVDSYKIFDTTGRLCHSGKQENVINVGHLSSGNYIIKVHTSKAVSSQRFVKR